MKKTAFFALAIGITSILAFSTPSCAKTPGEKLDNTIDKINDNYEDTKEKAKDKYNETKEKLKDGYNNGIEKIKTK